MKFKFTLNSISKLETLKVLFNILFGQSNRIYKKLIHLTASYFNINVNQIFFLASGRMGIYTLIKSLNLSKNDEVIVTGYTCVVVTNAVKLTGCQLKYIDINVNTLNIDTNQLLNNITSNTKLIIISHNFGLTYQDIELIKIKYPSIIILEDAAHCLGSSYNDKKTGTLADASFMSFEYSKPITSGIGGLLIINNQSLIHSYTKTYNTLGKTAKFEIFKTIITTVNFSLLYFKKFPSFNRYSTAVIRRLGLIYRTNQYELDGNMPKNYPAKLSPKLAVFLYFQIKKIEVINQKKQNQVELYNQYFKNTAHIITFGNKNDIMVRYPIVFDDNVSIKTINSIKAKLLTLGYNYGVWFDDVVHPKGSYRYMYQVGMCSNGEYISQRIINLPININYPLSEIDIKQIKGIITTELDRTK